MLPSVSLWLKSREFFYLESSLAFLPGRGLSVPCPPPWRCAARCGCGLVWNVFLYVHPAHAPPPPPTFDLVTWTCVRNTGALFTAMSCEWCCTGGLSAGQRGCFLLLPMCLSRTCRAGGCRMCVCFWNRNRCRLTSSAW